MNFCVNTCGECIRTHANTGNYLLRNCCSKVFAPLPTSFIDIMAVPSRPNFLQRILFKKKCSGTISFVKIQIASEWRCATLVCSFQTSVIIDFLMVWWGFLRKCKPPDQEKITWLPQESGKKKKHKDQHFGSGDCRVGWGVFHVEGWWSKSSFPPLEICFPWVSKGGTWDVLELAGMSRTTGHIQKVCAKKVYVLIFRP